MRHLSKVHNISVSDVKPFVCGVCTERFTYKGHLKTHLSTIHFIKDVETFECAICAKTYTQKCHLKTHLLSVHSFGDRLGDAETRKTFECDVCAKTFT